ncbi:MAG: 2OG-Fe(II) oxygenase [Pleurocapsa sp.]
MQIAVDGDRKYSSTSAHKKELKTQPLTIVNSERENIRSITKVKSGDSDLETKFFPAQYWQIDNFLPPQQYEQVLNTALSKQQEFKDSQTVNKKDRYRQSSVLPGKYFSEVYYSVKNKLLNTLPLVLDNLKHPEFFVSHVEMQMTAHNEGCFYKAHSDAGSAKTKTRELTYVYYFYQEPKPFTGGELKLYDTEMVGKKFMQQDNSKIVEPRNNSIVFFNSRCKHEVLPIECTSQQFENSRFTLNGWLRR